MTNLTKIIGVLLFGLSFASCHQTKSEKDNYSKDPKISNTRGVPKDSITFYFPTSIRQDTGIVKTEIDTFMMNWFSSALYSAKEPILYNYYLGHDIYRFLWLRSFHRPVVFSFHKDGNKVWLTTKELNKQPEFMDEYPPIKFIPIKLLPNGQPDPKQVRYKEKPDRKIIRKAERKADIILNQTKKLTEKDWTEFETLLSNCSFWNSKPYIEESGLDGSEWTIEGHLKNKYWFVNRWSPRDNFRKVGEFLIQKVSLKKKYIEINA